MNELSDLEKQRYDEWKYRHGLVYSLYFRYNGFVAAIAVFATLQTERLCVGGFSPVYLSIVALFLALTGIVHVAMEYARIVELRIMLRTFNDETRQNFSSIAPFWFSIKEWLRANWIFWALQIFITLTVPIYIYLISVGVCSEEI